MDRIWLVATGGGTSPALLNPAHHGGPELLPHDAARAHLADCIRRAPCTPPEEAEAAVAEMEAALASGEGGRGSIGRFSVGIAAGAGALTWVALPADPRAGGGEFEVRIRPDLAGSYLSEIGEWCGLRYEQALCRRLPGIRVYRCREAGCTHEQLVCRGSVTVTLDEMDALRGLLRDEVEAAARRRPWWESEAARA